MGDDEKAAALSALQEEERCAMVGERMAVLRVVSGLRQYREAARVLLASRYRDGECDRVALDEFANAVAEIEEA